MSQHPWWQPGEDDGGRDRRLPAVVVLQPDYGAELPLWGIGQGNISWQATGFTPELLDRLAAWQEDFEDGYHWETGWRSAELRDRWVGQADALAADVQAELGSRARLEVDISRL